MKHNVFFAAVICVFFWAGLAVAFAQDSKGSGHEDRQVYELVKGIGGDPSQKFSMQSKANQGKSPEHVERYSMLELDMELLGPETPLKEGDLLILDLFADTVFVVEISKISVSKQGILSIRGRDSEKGLESFTLSAKDNRASATYQDLESNHLYRIRFDADSEGHVATDYDVQKMPKGRGMEALKAK